MDYNKLLLGGKVINFPERFKMGELPAAKFQMEYSNYKKNSYVFTICVTNSKTIDNVLFKEWFKPGIEVFIDATISASSKDGMVKIFCNDLKICKFAPREPQAKAAHETPVNKEMFPQDKSFDDDDIPF